VDEGQKPKKLIGGRSARNKRPGSQLKGSKRGGTDGIGGQGSQEEEKKTCRKRKASHEKYISEGLLLAI